MTALSDTQFLTPKNLSDAERQHEMDEHAPARLIDDPALTRITDFAAKLCEVPISLVSLVEERRQWFPVRTGLQARETPRSTSFCAHAMTGADIMTVPDATLDPRFAANPLVTGDPNIRFYAGAPLITAEGVPLGALCVIDQKPRAGLTDLQRSGLSVLAEHVMVMLTAQRSERRAARQTSEHEERFRVLADTMPQMVWSTQPDGFHDYYNARWYEFTGMPVGSTDGEAWNGMFHPDDQDRAWATWRRSLETGEPYDIEYRLRNANGQYRWTLGRALPMRDEKGRITRWFGTCTDIDDQKRLAEQRELIAHELSHRIKNIFSVINGLVMLTARHRPELKEQADELRDRIVSLGKAHDLVRPHSDHSRQFLPPTTLIGLINELGRPYRGLDEARISVSGDDSPIDDHAATPLALVFHELATNAAKYGALSVPDGAVEVTITSDDGAAHIVWAERGGPAVQAPERTGFGSELMELSAVRQLAGTLDRDWRADGLHVSLRIPTPSLHRSRTIRSE